MKTEESKHTAFIQAFSIYLETLDLKRGYYDFSIKIVKSKNKDKEIGYSYMKECLVKSGSAAIIPFPGNIIDDVKVDKLVHMNQRLNLVLGYAMGLIFSGTLKTTEDELKRKWLIQAVENMCYLDLPLPPMP